MKGVVVPLVMIPRFTTYTGGGAFASAPLELAAFSKAVVVVWRGPLIGQSFRAVFEASHDAQAWTEVTSAITTPSATSTLEITLAKRWLRVKVELTANASNFAALTCWAVGSLERRLE